MKRIEYFSLQTLYIGVQSLSVKSIYVHTFKAYRLSQCPSDELSIAISCVSDYSLLVLQFSFNYVIVPYGCS